MPDTQTLRDLTGAVMQHHPRSARRTEDHLDRTPGSGTCTHPQRLQHRFLRGEARRQSFWLRVSVSALAVSEKSIDDARTAL